MPDGVWAGAGVVVSALDLEVGVSKFTNFVILD